MRKISDDPMTRYRFSCPSSDKLANDWIKEQRNLSASLRMVIKEYAARHGITDATCLPIATESAVNVPEVAQVTVKPEPVEQPVMKEIASVAKPVETPAPVSNETQTQMSEADAMLAELMN